MRKRISGWRILALGYLAAILVGGLLLSLPISSKTGEATNLLDSLFTATSATCVTGLIVYDTFLHWSLFGQIVILLLIQVGGLGFMTFITLFSLLLGRQINLSSRTLIMQATGKPEISGIIRFVKRIIIGTFIFETAGTILLSFAFVPKMGFVEGVYFSLFHSVSAFCNAGFDLMGSFGSMSSLTSMADNVLVNFTVMALIFAGGIGFLVWNDMLECKLRFSKFHLHTKIVLVASAVIVILPAALFLAFEYDNTLSGMNLWEKIMASLFQVITPRTAGFNTVDISMMNDSTTLLIIFLMFVGGNSGSTAGGIKLTTFIVIMLSVFNTARRKNELIIGRRRLERNLFSSAVTISACYLMWIVVASITLCALEPFGLRAIVFEVVSAIGTVGLSMGITSALGIVSKLILMFTMYVGRAGIITLLFALQRNSETPPTSVPTENLLIG
ncbi:MAG: TrkH family potassium uptake protein [Christensenellales bacterium]